MEIDLTGNWRESEHYQSFIKTHNAYLNKGETHTFFQSIILPADNCVFRLEYHPDLDSEPGRAINGNYNSFGSLYINGQIQFEPLCGEYEGKLFYALQCKLSDYKKGDAINLKLVWCSNQAPRTKLLCQEFNAEFSAFQAVAPAGSGKFLQVHGLPFMARSITYFRTSLLDSSRDNGQLAGDRSNMHFNCYGIKAKRVHFLGMVHEIDLANGSWYTPKGDHGFSHFAGDKAGEIIISWMDGQQTIIPLIFGFNLWFSSPWDTVVNTDQETCKHLFDGHPEHLDIIKKSLYLVDGIQPMGPDSCNARFVFSVDLGGRPIKEISLEGSSEMHGYPIISAITFETENISPELPVLPQLDNRPARIKPIRLEKIAEQAYLAKLEKVKRLLYTFTNALPVLDNPVVPKGYFGPVYDFRGPQQALYAASFLFRNGPECAAYIADSSFGCGSLVSSGRLVGAYTNAIGVWFKDEPRFKNIANWFKLYRKSRPGSFPGNGYGGWARGNGQLIREAMAFGYDKYVESFIDELDRCLFADANPPHWIRIAGKPNVDTYKVKVGEVEERGNRENDGHGICMWGRYMAYHWKGRPREWNKKHFAATMASVEWIQWMLDTDRIRPGMRKDVLFTESECASPGYDIFSSYNCLHGIKLAIRMARQLGKDSIVTRWTMLYNRLRQGILDHLADQSEFGAIWHTEPVKTCGWQDHAHKLVHLHLATEGDTYTPLQDYARDQIEKRYLEISCNSYRYLMKEKNYNCLRMYGYGQGMMAQAALLLDEMQDAEQFINLMVNYCYLPHLKEPWACPEGIIMHRSGEYYLPCNGYSPQDSHVADSAKSLRLMIGVDDNDPGRLRLIPRYPSSWTKISISGFPALTGNVRQELSYTYQRHEKRETFDFSFEHAVEKISLRLGPVSSGQRINRILVNGKAHEFLLEKSGDSNWVWIKKLQGKEGRIAIDYLQ